MDPDQLAHRHSLIRVHAVCLQTLLQVEKLMANSMDPDQTARMRRLVWIHAGHRSTMLVLSWRGSFIKINMVLTSGAMSAVLPPLSICSVGYGICRP
jgi:hypothetical protein